MKQRFAHVAAWLRAHAWQPLVRLFPRKGGRDASASEDLQWQPDGVVDSDGRAFAFTRGAVWYFVLLVGSLLFTQILRSRASHIFFVFVLMMLPALFLYTLTARASLKAFMVSNSRETEKMAPCEYEFRVTNEFIFAYPFVDAVIRIPRADAVRTRDTVARISMAPLAVYAVKNTISFRFRGTYEIGVRCFYVYDFFRILRIRVDADCYENFYVMPRKRMKDGSLAVAVSDIAKQTTKSPYTYDRLEISDIREYRLGDSLKSVHWNLSSKAEELVVRDYSSGVSNRAIVFCDMAAHFPTKAPEKPREQVTVEVAPKSRAEVRRERRRAEQRERWAAQGGKDSDFKTLSTEDPDVRDIADEEILAKSRKRLRAGSKHRGGDDLASARSQAGIKQEQTPLVDVCALAEPRYYDDMNEYCADGVVELTISTVLRELRDGNACTLIWFDDRAEGGVLSYELADEGDFEAIFRLFATAPLCHPDKKVAKLRAMVGDTQGIKQIFVIPAPDEMVISEFCNMPDVAEGTNFGAVEVLCYEPIARFAHVGERRAYLENGRALLSAGGLKMEICSESDDASLGAKEV